MLIDGRWLRGLVRTEAALGLRLVDHGVRLPLTVGQQIEHAAFWHLFSTTNEPKEDA